MKAVFVVCLGSTDEPAGMLMWWPLEDLVLAWRTLKKLDAPLALVVGDGCWGKLALRMDLRLPRWGCCMMLVG